MYKIGEFIVYGNEGVCEVEDVSKINSPITNKMTNYYDLKPLHGNGNILVPVGANVFMRLAITVEEIKKVITDIHEIRDIRFDIKNMRELQNHYKKLLNSHECIDIFKVIISLNNKKDELAKSNKKLGQLEVKFLKRAKELIEDEFSVVLGISKEEAEVYINQNILQKH